MINRTRNKEVRGLTEIEEYRGLGLGFVGMAFFHLELVRNLVLLFLQAQRMLDPNILLLLS